MVATPQGSVLLASGTSDTKHATDDDSVWEYVPSTGSGFKGWRRLSDGMARLTAVGGSSAAILSKDRQPGFELYILGGYVRGSGTQAEWLLLNPAAGKDFSRPNPTSERIGALAFQGAVVIGQHCILVEGGFNDTGLSGDIYLFRRRSADPGIGNWTTLQITDKRHQTRTAPLTATSTFCLWLSLCQQN